VAPAGRNGTDSPIKWWWFNELAARRKKRSGKRKKNLETGSGFPCKISIVFNLVQHTK